MEVTIEKREIKLKKVDVKFPIYSFIENDEAKLYTKLTEKEFYQIKINRFEVTINRFSTNNKTISNLWFENQCNKIDFEKAVEHVKNILKNS